MAPVVKLERSEQRKTAESAISSVVANRFSGTCASIVACICNGSAFSFVSHVPPGNKTLPGAMTFTLICGASFFESTLANVVIALLAVMYAVGAPMTSKPAIDETNRMTPFFLIKG